MYVLNAESLKTDNNTEGPSPLKSKDTKGSRKTNSSTWISLFTNENQSRVLVIVVIQFCFVFALSSVRTNFPMNLQLKYEASVTSIGYLNSLQSLTGALIGFAIGPVLTHVYKGNSRIMVIQAGTLEVVRTRLVKGIE